MKGKKLEKHGRDVFSGLGFDVDSDLDDTRLLDIDPDGTYEEDEHLEVDYLIPTRDIVLVGEITGRSRKSDVTSKLDRFKSHLQAIRSCKRDRDLWKHLGVPEDNIHKYLGIEEIKAFFITNKHNEYELSLPSIQNIVNFYKNNWETIEKYSETLGGYAKKHFLDRVGIDESLGVKKELILGENNSLSAQRYRSISDNVESHAHLYRFEISPFEILPITKVERRDNLPSPSGGEEDEYQRALKKKKIYSIRDILKENKKFSFPSNILCVLSEYCEYSTDKNQLTIPYEYGSLTVIDGQHRLYSYADKELEELLTYPLIPVTAVEFDSEDEESIKSYSAYVFLEINANQTRIKPKYLDAIAYDVLGETEKEYLAAKILKDVNEIEKDCLYGMFDVYQTGQGFLEIGTIRNKLSEITSLKKVEDLQNAERGDRLERRNGYENIFDTDIESLQDPDVLIQQGGVVLRRFFGVIRRELQHDWADTEASQSQQSTVLSLAKAYCGLIRLIRYFVENGYNWTKAENSISDLKNNVLSLRNFDNYNEENSPLLDKSVESLPDSGTSIMDFFRFFRDNVSSPTPIDEIDK